MNLKSRTTIDLDETLLNSLDRNYLGKIEINMHQILNKCFLI
jgi:hypothetical protein